MSTIGSLLALMDPNIRPWSEGVQSATQADTGLLKLADLKRTQAAEQAVMTRIQNDPALAQQLFGGNVPQSTLASLPTEPHGPGGGPMTQQTTMPGQPPGPPQVVPGGQDLSRFATQGAPGQSTIASLGPAGQAQMQAPRNPLLEMARTDPRAAMMLQDQQIKAFTTQLTIREKTAEAFATTLQGVNSQESYESAVQDLMQWAPQQAARLPRVWSKEGMQPIINSALSAKDKATLDIASLKEQTDFRTQLFKERQAASGVPKYTEDSTLNVAIDRRMQQAGIPRGTPPPEAILTQAQDDVQQGKVEVSAKQGLGAAEIERTEKPLEGVAGKAVSDLTLLRTMTDDVLKLHKDAYTGPLVGRSGYLREQAGYMDKEETAFRSTLKNVNDILGRLRSGANIPAPEMANLERLAPSANDPPETFKAKMQSFQRALEQQRESITRVGTTGRQQLREETTPTTPRVGEQPTSQGSTGTGGQADGKVVTRAALHAEAQRRKISPEKAEELAKAKGYTVQ